MTRSIEQTAADISKGHALLDKMEEAIRIGFPEPGHTKPGEKSALGYACDALGLPNGSRTSALRAALRATGRPMPSEESARDNLKGAWVTQVWPEPAKKPAKKPAIEPATPEERREIAKLKAEVSQLKRDRKDADGEAMLAEAIREARGAMLAEAVPPPAWAVRPDRSVEKGSGTPILMLTDWHVGETVNPREVYGLNQFDEATSDKRVRECVEKAIQLASLHAPASGVKGGVVFLGGDFVSGWLHDELIRTDWCSPIQSAVWCVSRLVWALRTLRDAWGRLYVVGVPGNHGRLTKRPPGKGHAFQTYDWLIYSMVAQQLAGEKGITVSVPDDGEQIVQVAGTRYMLQHGHQLGVKGGDGLIGAIGPIMRGSMKTGAQQRSVGRDFDVLVLGHYHQTLLLPRAIVCPTLKGFDEYSRTSRFGFEPASQLMWFSHPTFGPNSPMRIFLQKPPAREAVPFVALEAA